MKSAPSECKVLHRRVHLIDSPINPLVFNVEVAYVQMNDSGEESNKKIWGYKSIRPC